MKIKQPRKPARSAVVDRDYQRALDLFERAVKALGRKDFDRARVLLDSLLSDYPGQQDLVERARAYRSMCVRPRRVSRPRPKTFEELLNYGVVLHNRGDFAQAVKYLSLAVAQEPRSESALYCLAAAQARAGETAAALRALRSAINANPSSRAQARHDADFEPLRGAIEFRALVAPSLP
jgi:tetratricopeptide (TPR) repeat protein